MRSTGWGQIQCIKTGSLEYTRMVHGDWIINAERDAKAPKGRRSRRGIGDGCESAARGIILVAKQWSQTRGIIADGFYSQRRESGALQAAERASLRAAGSGVAESAAP